MNHQPARNTTAFVPSQPLSLDDLNKVAESIAKSTGQNVRVSSQGQTVSASPDNDASPLPVASAWSRIGYGTITVGETDYVKE